MRQLVDGFLACYVRVEDNDDCVLSCHSAKYAVEMLAVNVASQHCGIAWAGAHHGDIAREVEREEARVAQKFGGGDGRDGSPIARVLREEVAITLLAARLDGMERAEVAREGALRDVVPHLG